MFFIDESRIFDNDGKRTSDKIGDLSQLKTTEKSSLTKATNELASQLAETVKKVNGVSPDADGNVIVEGGNVDTNNLATKDYVQEQQLSTVYAKRSSAVNRSISTTDIDNKITLFNELYEPKIRKRYGLNMGSEYTKTIWLWEYADVKTSPDEILNVCEKTFINRIYIQIHRGQVSDAQYAYFISEATKRNIKVEALYGDATYALATNKHIITTSIQGIVDYNSSVAPDKRFSGIHLDIEPYTLNIWNSGTVAERQTILTDWYDNSVEWANLAHTNGMTISASVSMYMDDSANMFAAQPPSMAKPFYQMFYDLHDQIAIMSYRDKPFDQLNVSKGDLAYLDNKELLIGFETGPYDTNSVTYYEEGYATFDLATRYIHSVLSSGYNGYGGIAIHDYSQFKKWYDTFAIESALTEKDSKKITSYWNDICNLVEKLSESTYLPLSSEELSYTHHVFAFKIASKTSKGNFNHSIRCQIAFDHDSNYNQQSMNAEYIITNEIVSEIKKVESGQGTRTIRFVKDTNNIYVFVGVSSAESYPSLAVLINGMYDKNNVQRVFSTNLVQSYASGVPTWKAGLTGLTIATGGSGGVTINDPSTTSTTETWSASKINTELGKKVATVAGKAFSTNDYTTTEKTKLTGIADSATKAESSTTNGNIKINGTETKVYTPPTDTKIETRTTDPVAPEIGRIWLRSDL